MIVRTWCGRALARKAGDYYHHFTTEVVRNLNASPGNKGAYLLQRDLNGEVEFLAVTLWDSIETIKQFSGDDPDVAHIEPEGRAALAVFDEFARNYRVAFASIDSASG